MLRIVHHREDNCWWLPRRASVGGRIRWRAFRTEAEHLEGMGDLGVPVLIGDSLGPVKDGLAGNFDGVSA